MLVGASVFGLAVLTPLLAYWCNLLLTTSDDANLWQGFLVLGIFLLIGVALVVQLVWNTKKIRSQEQWRPFDGRGQYVRPDDR
jgi:apolipoprotein N-acyltransferase